MTKDLDSLVIAGCTEVRFHLLEIELVKDPQQAKDSILEVVKELSEKAYLLGFRQAILEDKS